MNSQNYRLSQLNRFTPHLSTAKRRFVTKGAGFILLPLSFFLLFLSSSFALTVDITESLLLQNLIDAKNRGLTVKVLKPLLSPESIERSWQSLEEIYGGESVSQARKLARMIDEENNRSNPA